MELILRKFCDDDINLFEKWLAEDYIAKWYNPAFEWLDEVGQQRNWIQRYIAVYGSEPIGFCQYYEYKKGKEDWHGSADITNAYSIDYLIGERDYLKKGLGRELVLTAVSKIASLTDAEKIIVKPDDENTASCRTLLSAGFIFDEFNKIYVFNLPQYANK
ncbi:MAG: GNAT family N-acetyltransferase [Eubacteriaceae bacterium]|nr:GNAT family N-acetyltransferase [Eubacteriaceae bacterium]